MGTKQKQEDRAAIGWYIPLIIVIAHLILAVLFIQYGPERIPSHWNIQGVIDGTMSRARYTTFMLVIVAGLYGLFTILPKLDPHRDQYPLFKGYYQALQSMILVFLFAVHEIVFLYSKGIPIDVPRSICVAISILFIMIGSGIHSVKRNWFVGVRTPWTLSSVRVWDQTHRAARPIFITSGSVFVLAGFVLPLPWALGAGLLSVLGATLGLVVYSYILYRNEPR